MLWVIAPYPSFRALSSGVVATLALRTRRSAGYSAPGWIRTSVPLLRSYASSNAVPTCLVAAHSRARTAELFGNSCGLADRLESSRLLTPMPSIDLHQSASLDRGVPDVKTHQFGCTGKYVITDHVQPAQASLGYPQDSSIDCTTTWFGFAIKGSFASAGPR